MRERNASETRVDVPRVIRGTTVTVRCGNKKQICILRDASPKGAGLIVNLDFELPKEFELELAGWFVPVRVVWRHRNRIGVRFKAPKKSILSFLYLGAMKRQQKYG